jgi:hypothetical protein
MTAEKLYNEIFSSDGMPLLQIEQDKSELLMKTDSLFIITVTFYG